MSAKKIKTFNWHKDDDEDYLCCLTKGDDNAIFVYFMTEDGYWEDLIDATEKPGNGVFVPAGCVCINNECENAGILDVLVNIGVIQAPTKSLRVGKGYKRLELCEVNEKVLDEWDASEVLYQE